MGIVWPGTVVMAETIKVGGTGSIVHTMQRVADAFRATRPDAGVEIVPVLGSRGAKRGVLSGAIDVALSAAPLTDDERTQGLVATEYVVTPFVFAVPESNPLTAVTTQDVVNIYSGKTITWPDGKRLRLVLRPPGDSDNTVLKGMSPAMAQAVTAALSRPGMNMADTDADAADAIETIPGAFGTTTLGLIMSERRSLRALSLDGVSPGDSAAANTSYPHVKRIDLVISAKAPRLARDFVNFALSAAGQAALRGAGFFPAAAKGRR